MSDFTDAPVQRMVDELVGREYPHLTGWITRAIAGPLLGVAPNCGVRMDLEPVAC